MTKKHTIGRHDSCCYRVRYNTKTRRLRSADFIMFFWFTQMLVLVPTYFILYDSVVYQLDKKNM